MREFGCFFWYIRCADFNCRVKTMHEMNVLLCQWSMPALVKGKPVSAIGMSFAYRWLLSQGYISRRRKHKRAVSPQSMCNAIRWFVWLQLKHVFRARMIPTERRVNIDQIPWALDFQSKVTFASPAQAKEGNITVSTCSGLAYDQRHLSRCGTSLRERKASIPPC